MSSITTHQDLIKKTADNSTLLRCLFELTYKCNLNCIHCYTANHIKSEIGKKEVFNILTKLKEIGCLYITFSGGEIFTRKDFFEIAEYSRKLNFALRLFTNGTLIDQEIADKIKSLRPLSVEISLYGFRNTHEKITQIKGSFDKTIRAIRLLKRKKINIFAKAILTNYNVTEFWELHKFVKKELKIEWRGIGGSCLISPCDDGDTKPLNYRVSDEQLRNYIKKEIEMLKSLGEDFKPRKIKRSEMLCGAGLGGCNITPYGEVNPCVQIRLKKGNSLKDTPFMEIWKNNSEIKKLRNLDMDDKKDCWGCEYISYCFVCPGIALLEKGSLLAKLPEACRQARIRKEVYGGL